MLIHRCLIGSIVSVCCTATYAQIAGCTTTTPKLAVNFGDQNYASVRTTEASIFAGKRFTQIGREFTRNLVFVCSPVPGLISGIKLSGYSINSEGLIDWGSQASLDVSVTSVKLDGMSLDILDSNGAQRSIVRVDVNNQSIPVVMPAGWSGAGRSSITISMAINVKGFWFHENVLANRALLSKSLNVSLY